MERRRVFSSEAQLIVSIPTTPRYSAGSRAPFPASVSLEVADGAREASAKNSPSALALSDERFRALFDAAPLAVGITREGILIYANPALAALVGVPDAAQLIGRYARDFVDPTRHTEIEQQSSARVEDGFYSQPTFYDLTVHRADGELIPIRIEVAPISLPEGEAIISFAVDLSNERRAHDEIRALLEREKRSAGFARQLQQLSQSLSDASSSEEVACIVVESCLHSIGAFGSIFVVPREDETGETKLYLSQSRGYSAEAVAGWATMGIHDVTPVSRAYRDEEAIWVGDVTDPQQIEQFPMLAGAITRAGTYALVALPLRLETRVLGVLGLSFDTPREFDIEERLFLETLAASCAQALERARLNTQSREMVRRQRESLALLNILLDSAPVGFALFDRDHHYILVNEELARINSLPVADHIGLRPTDLLPSLGARVESLLEQVWETGLPSGEAEFIQGAPEDGAGFRHCTMSLYPIRVSGTETQSGEILGVGAILIEQTARVRGEIERERLFDQLEMERARFEAILQQMPSGVVIAEAPSGRLVLGNEQVARIWGHTYENSRGVAENIASYRGFHPDGRELQSNEWPMSRAIEFGEIVRGEEIIIERGNGERGVIRINAAPIRDNDNNITAGVAVFDNVTARARADTSQRFLAEAGSVLVSAQDENQTFQAMASLCVPRATDLCAFLFPESEQLLRVAALTATTHLSGHAQNTARLEALLARDAGTRQIIASVMQAQRGTLSSLPKPDGTQSEFAALLAGLELSSILIAPLMARGRSIGAMLWLNTTSKRPLDNGDLELAEELARRVGLSADNARLLQDAQQARDAAQRARDEAQAANRAKDEFLAIVSHELRTPLTPILGWLELLRSPNADDALRAQAFDVIERNALAQAQLVNDILDVSRITTGKLRLELKNISLDDVVTRAVESLRTVWTGKQLKVELSTDPSLRMRGDAHRLNQVIWNLLQNAIKFTPANGSIKIVLRKLTTAGSGPKAYLEVHDTGTGIQTELVPHIFERFRQGDSSATRTAGGLGLGLAIVKHIVELHGGSAGVSSAGRGQGSTFWVELPLPNEAQSPGIPFSARPRLREGCLKNAQVLIVDDEPDAREMLARLLEEAGAIVRVASGALMALEIVAQFAPSVIVSDIGMPEMDGLQLRRELLARGFHAPAIALTAYASSKDESRAREAGFERYLAKPIGAQELVDAIIQMLCTT